MSGLRHRGRRQQHARRGQDRREGAALAGFALDNELRLVAKEHVANDGETQPRAAGRARTAAVDAIEALGESGDVLGGDANAGVRDRERPAAVGADVPCGGFRRPF